MALAQIFCIHFDQRSVLTPSEALRKYIKTVKIEQNLLISVECYDIIWLINKGVSAPSLRIHCKVRRRFYEKEKGGCSLRHQL